MSDNMYYEASDDDDLNEESKNNKKSDDEQLSFVSVPDDVETSESSFVETNEREDVVQKEKAKSKDLVELKNVITLGSLICVAIVCRKFFPPLQQSPRSLVFPKTSASVCVIPKEELELLPTPRNFRSIETKKSVENTLLFTQDETERFLASVHGLGEKYKKIDKPKPRFTMSLNYYVGFQIEYDNITDVYLPIGPISARIGHRYNQGPFYQNIKAQPVMIFGCTLDYRII